MQAATMLCRTGGDPLPDLLDALARDESLIDVLRRWTERPGHPPLGAGRATAIAASALVPFALAYAADIGDPGLEDAAHRAWAGLRHREWTRPAKRALAQVTGGPPIRGLGERGHQGLLHLDRHLCTPRRCHECPIAHAVIRDRVG
jgi:hypothetical protein